MTERQRLRTQCVADFHCSYIDHNGMDTFEHQVAHHREKCRSGSPIEHSVQSNRNWRATVVNPDLQYRVHLVVAHKAHGFLDWVMEFSDCGRAYSRSDPSNIGCTLNFIGYAPALIAGLPTVCCGDCKNGEVKRSSA